MKLSVTVLGSSGSYSGPGNPCSGYFVDDGTTRVWLDCGPGTLGPLQDHVELHDLDAVVVTHSHPDHCLDLPVFRNALRFVLEISGVPVYGPAQTRATVEAALNAEVAPTLDWHTVSDGSTFAVGGLSFACSRTDHPVETMAVRIEDGNGGAVAYSADTGAAWSFERFDAPVGLAICEATLAADAEGSVQHLSGRQAGELARQVSAERLVLTHLTPGTDGEARRDEAASAFDGPIEVARAGDRFEV